MPLLLYTQQVLDNETILKLVKAGLSEDVIVGMVNAQAGKYSTTADDVISLKTSGVSDKIIGAMVNRGATPTVLPSLPPSSVPATNSPSGELVVHDATPIRLRLSRNLSSADAKTGDTVDFKVRMSK